MKEGNLARCILAKYPAYSWDDIIWAMDYVCQHRKAYSDDKWTEISEQFQAMKWDEDHIMTVKLGVDTKKTISPGFYADLILWRGYQGAQPYMDDLDRMAKETHES